jgi:CubicO group peptidase (beta-lactamase class C family)
MLFLQAAFTQSKFAEFENSIEARKKTLGNDLVVVVANKDTILYQKTFGEISVKAQVPIGATSQWLTTAMVLLLVDEGKISLDDNISRYIPLYDKYFKSYITIRHCLSHMTGIQAEDFKNANLTAKRNYNSLEEEVADFAKKEIRTNAGEEFRYSMMGANIAAYIVEAVTKKKFEAIIKTRLLNPLGMRNTSFTTDDGSATNPSSGAKSSAGDLTKFLQMLLNNGKLNGKQILSENAIAEMKKIQVSKDKMKFSPKATEDFYHALGAWAIEGGENIGETATVLTSPGFLGVWPIVDFNRGYAFVFFPKSTPTEQSTNVYLGLKGELDELNLKAANK